MLDFVILIYYCISKRFVKGLVKELLVSIEKKIGSMECVGFFFYILCNIFG